MAQADFKVIGGRGQELFSQSRYRTSDRRSHLPRWALPYPQGERSLFFADQVLKAFIPPGIDSKRGVAQHRFGPSGGDLYKTALISQRVFDRIQPARPLLVFHLYIGECGAAVGTPVDAVVALVD